MLKLGISNKVKIQIDPTEGFPKIIAVGRIIQGEPIETVCGHDLNMLQAKLIFSMSKSFTNCIRPNPIKSRKMNEEMDELLKKLRTELIESNELVTQKELDDLPNDPRFLEKMQDYHWIDFLSGNVSLYTVSDYPNAAVEWNDQLCLWQIISTKEILPDEIVSLPKPTE